MSNPFAAMTALRKQRRATMDEAAPLLATVESILATEARDVENGCSPSDAYNGELAAFDFAGLQKFLASIVRES